MSNLETAKQLLKKGIELGDQELIEMANSMLGETQVLWYCEKCEDTFDNTKGRKSCPKCKGRKISPVKPVQMQADVQPTRQNDDFSMIGDTKPPRGLQVDGRNFRPGKFKTFSVSDKELAQEENVPIEVFQIKETNIPSQRRPAAKEYITRCNYCSRDIKSWSPFIGTFHVCNRCGNR